MKKEEFEESMRWRFSGATVISKGKVVIDKGKIVDRKWWKDKVNKAWKERQENSSRFTL